jgi:hypothetical protein
VKVKIFQGSLGEDFLPVERRVNEWLAEKKRTIISTHASVASVGDTGHLDAEGMRDALTIVIFYD